MGRLLGWKLSALSTMKTWTTLTLEWKVSYSDTSLRDMCKILTPTVIDRTELPDIIEPPLLHFFNNLIKAI